MNQFAVLIVNSPDIGPKNAKCRLCVQFVDLSIIWCMSVLILPNRSDVLPVNMRCTRAAVGQYESCLPWCFDVFEECAVFLLVLPLFSLHYFQVNCF